MSEARSQLAGRIHEARPRVVAALAAQLRDLDLAEEAFASACESLLATAGPEIRDAAAWLYRAALRKAIDVKRKAKAEARAGEASMALVEASSVIALPDPIPDERLRLLFVCCHPALAAEARVALALKVVCGVPAEQIARAFALPVPTMYQRITRAKAKIAGAKIPFELPHRFEWPERVSSVLGAIEVGYLIGYADAGGAGHPEFASETGRLADMMVELVPDDPEAKGLAALLALAASRKSARIDASGAMVPLSRQDADLWDKSSIEKGRALLDMAAEAGRPGPYQTLAAIHLVHARRAFGAATDWRAILSLYDALLSMRPGPMVAVNRALAVGEVQGPDAGLAALDAVDVSKLAGHRPLFVARARLLEQAGRGAEAAAMLERALATEPGAAERRFLEKWQDM